MAGHLGLGAFGHLVVGMALAMLVVVLVLEVNLRNEYLGASVFDAPTFVASDLFPDEVEGLGAIMAALKARSLTAPI